MKTLFFNPFYVHRMLPFSVHLMLPKVVHAKLLITEKYKTTNIKRIKSFINGIYHDLEAIKNAIKYSWSNGVVEGHVNRLKNKKREMYGRPGFELLRRKVILSKSG